VATLLAFATLPISALARHADLAPVRAQVAQQHDANVKRLKDWIALPSIAAENLNSQRRRVQAQLLRDAGFQHVEIIATDGKPGVFATLDAGAKKTVGVYFMYDVKQYDPTEWSSPPLEGRIVDKPGVGKVMMGRGAVNQKGPRRASSPRCTRSGARTEAAGEPRAGRRGRGRDRLAAHRPARARAEVQAALAKTVGVFMPTAMQEPRRRGHREPRAQGRRRARARSQRREVGPRPEQGHPLLAQGDGRQPGLATW
jgi:hypothetical protein